MAAGATGFNVILIILILAIGAKIGLAFIPANIAKKKGYGFGGFYVLGLFFFLLGLIVSLCLDDKNAQIYQMTNAIHSISNNPVQSQPSSIGDELKKYNDLLLQGAISQEEFDSLKTKLLDRADRVCPNCGATAKQGSAFCAKCGTRIF